MEKAIDYLQQLDLKKLPVEEARKMLGTMGNLPFMVSEFAPGKLIDRAVLNSDIEPEFNTKARIFYKPAQFNNTFQRASSPSQTMFYGSIIPEEILEGEIDNARITTAFELVDLLRDTNSGDGERVITYGKWLVTEKLSLIAIVDPQKQYKVKYLNDIGNDYRNQMAGLPVDLQQKTQDWLSFLTNEFRKDVKKDEEYNYMISGLFSEIAAQMNVDGVLYPSVRTNEDGICIAIKPQSAEAKLELIKVLQCKLVKVAKKVTIVNLKYCDVPNNNAFQLKPIKP